MNEAALSADRLLKEPAQWPLVSALQRFSLPLQRLTNVFLKFSKKWFPRFFVLENGRLYYCDGNNGYPDSKEGTLSFVRSNPAPDERYCVELKGCSVGPCSSPVDGQSFAFEIKFPAGDKVHQHAGTVVHTRHTPSCRLQRTCVLLLPMTSRASAACAPFKPRAQAAAAPRCRTLRHRWL